MDEKDSAILSMLLLVVSGMLPWVIRISNKVASIVTTLRSSAASRRRATKRLDAHDEEIFRMWKEINGLKNRSGHQRSKEQDD